MEKAEKESSVIIKKLGGMTLQMEKRRISEKQMAKLLSQKESSKQRMKYLLREK